MVTTPQHLTGTECALDESMPTCIVRSCSNVYRPKPQPKSNAKLSFHAFPRNEKLRNRWLLAVSRIDVPRYARICSEHFSDEDYTTGTSLTCLIVDNHHHHHQISVLVGSSLLTDLLWHLVIPPPRPHHVWNAFLSFHSILNLLSTQNLSNLPLKQFTLGAPTTSSGKLFHRETIHIE